MRNQTPYSNLFFACISLLTSLSAIAGDLTQITGQYSNSRSDQLSFTYDSDGEAFGVLDFSGNGMEFEFSDSDQVVTDDGSFTFQLEENNCDDPGCMTYEGSVSFKKNQQEKYYVSAHFNILQDVEDLSPTYQDLLNEDLTESEISQILDQECQSYFEGSGFKDVHLDYFADDYKHSVYCGYSVQIYLKKDD